MRFHFVVVAGLLLGALPCLGQEGPPQEKNPWAAAGLSFLLPGGGQFYNGETNEGLGLLAVALGGYGIMWSAAEDNGEHCTATFNGRTYSRDDFFACRNWVDSQIRSSRGSWQAKVEASTDYDFDGDDDRLTIGAWIYVGAWAWSMIDAWRSANRIKEAAAESSTSLKVVPTVTPDRTGARVVMRF